MNNLIKIKLDNKSTSFGSHKEFKKMFKICSYSGGVFEPGDTKTLEHIIPESRGGEKILSNLIVVKRSVNSLRSSTPLGEFINKYPEVAKNILRTLEEFKGKIIDGVNWAKEVRKTLYAETHNAIFK